MENKVSEWFSNEVIFGRYCSSILWTLLLQSAVLSFAVISTSFVFTDGLLLTLTYCVASLFFTFLLAVVHINNFTVNPRRTLSILEAVKVWFNPRRWICIAVFSILSIFSIKCFGALLGNYSLYEESIMCSTTGVNCCLSEKHFFNVLHGAFVGVIFGCNYFFRSGYLLEFPTIEQLKFQTMKMKMKKIIFKSATAVLRNLRWFYLSYYVFGNYIKSFVSTITDYSFCNQVSLTSMPGLADIHLFWVTWLSAVILCVIWSAFIAFFQIFMTEHYQFEVGTTLLEKDVHITLNTVLNCSDLPIMQYLAMHDFVYLSQHSVSRRMQILQVSNPGGHPLQWNAICSHMLTVIDHFLGQLTNSSSGAISYKLPNPTEKVAVTPNSPRPEDGIRDLSNGFSSPVAYKRLFIKNLTRPVGHTEQQGFAYNEQRHVNAPENFVSVQRITELFSSKISQLMSKAKEETFLKYLIIVTPEAKLESIFITSQSVIWAVQGLCFMVRASFREDKYGVVQRWLPDILSKLLDLQTALERSQKMLTKKQNQAKRGVQMRQSLRVALNTGLYGIVCSFKPHLGCIKLTDEHRHRLLQYENFMA